MSGSVGRHGRHSRPADAKAKKKSRPLWLEVGGLLVLALVTALLLRTFLVGVYFIPSGSMENTLHVGDRVVVDKVGYHLHDIHRGDVIVFNGEDSFTPEGLVAAPATNPVSRALNKVRGFIGAAPAGERDFIKRVIGVPGDHVVCCDSQGRVTVNGVPLDEPYLYPGDQPSTEKFDVIVPPGRLWVMGDHRGASADSRSHLGDPGGGTVPEDRVIGRARVILWPLGNLGRLKRPSTFDQPALDASRGGTTAARRSLAPGSR